MQVLAGDHSADGSIQQRGVERLEDHRHGWHVSESQCLCCGSVYISIHPVLADDNTLQCPKCMSRCSHCIQHYDAPEKMEVENV
jgi:hypothetical protein